MRVLVTGAAGFIGSAACTALRSAGHDVVGLDAAIHQAHGSGYELPLGVEAMDLRNLDGLEQRLSGTEVVCHQAAMVGAGVDASDLPEFAAHNDLGTANLLAAMAAAGVHRLVLASSMVVYGDGRYVCPDHGDQKAQPRRTVDLDRGRFDLSCRTCGRDLTWSSVDEDAPLDPRSGYAASKVAQEHYTRAWARQTGSAVIALRYHNVYGPGMPQDTPYSGVAAIFRSDLERGAAPRVFEDGGQMRDFVHVSDVVTANLLACEAVRASGPDSFTPYNVCSGIPVSIAAVAQHVADGTGHDSVAPVITGAYRLGDVRHIVASPARATQGLGFKALVRPAEGLAEFATAPLRSRHQRLPASEEK
jgi:dTDP-L-rhamnose 4-epimerase